MLIRIPRRWAIPEREATPEDQFLNRRQVLRAGAIAAAALAAPPLRAAVQRNPKYKLDRPLTDERIAATYNNFYEFNQEDKTAPARLVEKFTISPWQIEVTGLVEKKMRFDVQDLVRKMPVEERLYRFRCVEAWAMAVPWTGFPMTAFLDYVKPLSTAKFIRFVSFYRPHEAPGFQRYHWYPWPYFEGLSLAEASNELAMMVTGIYGHDLPKQQGAPIRVITPWKYGYKSIKSIVKIEFTKSQPPTFWNQVAPTEYDFWSNVNPKVPHPRWSQASERMIDTGERRPTLMYNGYEEFVVHLYS
ncbi:MAG: protein-methionine-sulfoxide reductase catalytic subunit MsrP, partial [Gammaproteobacteria bacterium]